MVDKLNVMVGTSPSGQGGIASVIRGYQSLGLFESHHIALVTTHHSAFKNPLIMILIYLKGLLHFSWLALTKRIGWVHIHLSQKGSYQRKKWIARIAHKTGAKVLLHLHSGGFIDFYNQQNKKQQTEIANLFQQADAIITLSRQSAQWITDITQPTNAAAEAETKKQRPHILYNTVPALELDLSQRQQQRVLFLGNLTKAKGVYDLVKVFIRLINDFPNAQLRLGGTGDTTQIQQMINEHGVNQNITLLGWVDGASKKAELQQADIFCLPSYHEQMPMSLLEAMSAQMTVVVSAVGGIPDIIDHDQNGKLIQAGDQEALYKALHSFFTQPNATKALAEKAQNDFNLKYSEPVMLTQLNQLYQSLETSS